MPNQLILSGPGKVKDWKGEKVAIIFSIQLLAGPAGLKEGGPNIGF